MKITAVGIGDVGLSIATLMVQHYIITAVEIIPEKAELINKDSRLSKA